MSSVLLVVEGILVLIGSLFVALAALGLVRLPDIYTRMHAASKAGAVGAGFLLLALALKSESQGETLRAFAAIIFFLLTAPIAAHLLAKAAYTVGYELWPGSVLDEMPKVEPSTGANVAAGRSEEDLYTGKALEPAWRREKREAPPRWSEMRRK